MEFKTKKVRPSNDELRIILGAYLKYQREYDGISLNYVADGIGINKGYLSEIEHGVKNLSDKYYFKIMNFYEIDFNNDPLLLKEARDFLKEIVLAYVYLDTSQEKNLIEKVLNKKDIYINSYAFFCYSLIEYIYYVRIKRMDNIVKDKEILLSDYTNILNSIEKAIFYDTLAYYKMSKWNYKSANKILNKAYDEIKKTDSSEFQSVIKYHKILTLSHSNNNLHSYLMCLDVKQEYSYYHNYKRIYYLDITMGICLTRMGLYKEAQKVYKDVLKKANFPNSSELLSLIFFALSWNYIFMSKYKKAIEYAIRAIEKNHNFDILKINIIFSYYSMTDYENCLREINNVYIHKDSNQFIRLYAKMIESLISKEDDKFIRISDAFYKRFCHGENFEISRMVLSLMISFYLERNDLRKVVEKQHLMIKISKHY